MKKLLSVCIFCLFSLIAVSNLDARTTRDLVFEDDESTANSQSSDDTAQTLAIKSTIVLTRDGKTSTVVPSHEFVSGDKIKLVFTPNTDGYVYWMTKGSSGDFAVLFPSKKTGEDNSVKRNQEYTIPVKGTFKFDEKAGKEELLCILSTERLEDIEKVVAANASLEGIATGLEVTTEAKDDGQKRTTRDLVFEDEDAGDVNTKSQTVEKGKPMVTRFVLTHK